jgi:murein DD-endopeptidase MepM/ murein hydrolase activator NlpD
MTLVSHPGDGRRDRRWRLLAAGLAVAGIAAVFAVTSPGTGAAPVNGNRGLVQSLAPRQSPAQAAIPESDPQSDGHAGIVASLEDLWSDAPRIRLRYSRTLRAPARADAAADEQAAAAADPPAPVLEEHAFTVRPGDSLYTLFKAEGLDRRDLAAIMAAGKSTSVLSRLRPGDRIRVYTDVGNRVQGLVYERTRGKRLDVARDGDRFRTGVRARPANAVMIDLGSDNSNDWVELHKPAPALARHTVSVSNGDSLYSIFKKNGFRLADLDAIVKASDDTRELRRLVPGQRMDFHLTPDNGVSKLVHYLDDTRTLHVRRNGVGYDSRFVDVPLDRHVATATGTIESSLFIAAQREGLSSNIIMQMVEIFGWDVDFALDIRAGDRFAVVYDELYKDGKKLRDGNILAASFTNQGKTTRIVRYEYPDGRSSYFTPEGVSIRKAFLRTPVNYARISSGFSLRRKHPVLHKFRAHRGVDYAAPRGTPIKATGDGKIEFIGYKGGYGKTIVLRHGSTYTTLYAHMSRYAKRLRRGQRVSQGQTIGYIGSTGLSTGPHLHYEFRVRGVHRNPLRVKLPKASPIEKKYEQHFLSTTQDLVARLGIVSNPTLAADERRLTDTD